MTLEETPWFVAKDVCDVLGFSGYASHHTRRLGSEEIVTIRRDSHTLRVRDHAALFDHKAPIVTLISESGLYKLIMRSDKPQAKPFQDWVTKEVLPSIRKTGAYVAGQMSLVENPQMTPIELMMAQAHTAFNHQKSAF